jgi:hypothetical protein
MVYNWLNSLERTIAECRNGETSPAGPATGLQSEV